MLTRIRYTLPRIAPLFAVLFVLAQVMLTAHTATFGPGDHLHGTESCSVGTLSKSQTGCDLGEPPVLVLGPAAPVIESSLLPAFRPAEAVAPSSRGPPALS